MAHNEQWKGKDNINNSKQSHEILNSHKKKKKLRETYMYYYRKSIPEYKPIYEYEYTLIFYIFMCLHMTGSLEGNI